MSQSGVISTKVTYKTKYVEMFYLGNVWGKYAIILSLN